MQRANNNRPDRGKNKKSGNEAKLSAGEKRDLLARQLGIKPKTKAMVDMLDSNSKIAPVDAYLATHKTTSRKNASSAASKLLKKPSVIGYRDSAVKKAKLRIITLVDSSNESVALKASESIIDRNEGKAIQKSENTNRTVEVKLDLTGVRIGGHYLAPTTPTALPE